MTYEVKVSFGSEGSNVFKIENVKDIYITEETYSLHSEDGNILFSTTSKNLVYLRKL
ncbi:hypothetical protein [Psychrobacillus sp. BM2]|uniref:hypothetical protein n=1 Tax=Psychrobacillus sp. BM2 TaxID=3400421 RepID=UPI003B02E073